MIQRLFRVIGTCNVGLCLLTVALVSLCTLQVQAETPEEKGLSIAVDADARNQGFQDFTASLKMKIRNKQGRESVHQMRFKVMEVDDDGDKSCSFLINRQKCRGQRY